MNAKTKAYIDAMAKQKNKYRKEEVCQYRGDGDRWCKMTTNKKCDRCRFFVPSTPAVFDACVTAVEQAAVAHEECKKFLGDAKRITAEMQQTYDKVLIEYSKLDSSGITKLLLQEIWEASVNSYGM